LRLLPLPLKQQAMRDERDKNYGNFNREFRQGGQSRRNNWHYQGRENASLGDTRNQPGQNYRLQQSQEYGRRGGPEGAREDRYYQMYDISNYSDQPRTTEYGLPYGSENDLTDIERFPYSEGPYASQPRHYSYEMGYNANFDNPEEGDRYRDFDSRGNHGYRHDPGYGNEGSFREFGDDHFGDRNRGNNPYYGHFGGYDR
jgi:hypothetical protein